MSVAPLPLNAMGPKSRQMPRKRDEQSGKYETAYPDEDFIQAVQDGDQPSTPEIADTLGCAERTALVRLNELADEGRLRKRKVGSVNLWSVADEEDSDQ